MNEIPAGICLAAGASSRMGRPKALLPVAGRTALAGAAESLSAGGCEPVVLVLGSKADRIRREAGLTGAERVVVHPGWARGRTGSLKAGLRGVTGAPAVVLLPVDFLLVGPAEVRALIEAWRRTGAPLVRPVRNGRGGHPVLFARSLYPEILALGDDEPLRTVLAAHREEEETIPGPASVLVDVNRPEEYERLRDRPDPSPGEPPAKGSAESDLDP